MPAMRKRKNNLVLQSFPKLRIIGTQPLIQDSELPHHSLCILIRVLVVWPVERKPERVGDVALSVGCCITQVEDDDILLLFELGFVGDWGDTPNRSDSYHFWWSPVWVEEHAVGVGRLDFPVDVVAVYVDIEELLLVYVGEIGSREFVEVVSDILEWLIATDKCTLGEKMLGERQCPGCGQGLVRTDNLSVFVTQGV